MLEPGMMMVYSRSYDYIVSFGFLWGDGTRAAASAGSIP